MYEESNTETYITICQIDSQWKSAVWLRELKPRLCNNLDRWDGEGGGREFQEEGTYVYLWLIHVDVWQKPTQYYKAIILQLKTNFWNKIFKKGRIREVKPLAHRHTANKQREEIRNCFWLLGHWNLIPGDLGERFPKRNRKKSSLA